MQRVRMLKITVLALAAVVLGAPAAEAAFFDSFSSTGINYTGSNSYGSGGSFAVSGGKLNITTGSNNTFSVMTTGQQPFAVGEVLSLDVPPVSGTQGVFMMCSTTPYQPNGSTSFGFRFRRGGGIVRIDRYPGGAGTDTADPCSASPAILIVARIADANFVYSIKIEGVQTLLGSFTLPSLAAFSDLHIGAQAFEMSSHTFSFDNLSVQPRIHNVTRDIWYDFIQLSIDDANDGDHIAVAPGIYHESLYLDGTYLYGKEVHLYSTGGPGVTTINGNGAYHVVHCANNVDANIILEGFTITGGNANGLSGPDNGGGGMFNNSSSPTVTNCTFSGNTALDYGGGLYNYSSSPTVTNCTFSTNTANFGGGMYNEFSNLTVTNCTFVGNTADYGGGMHNYNSGPAMTNCTFIGNTGHWVGGGMNNDNSSPTVTDCTFTGNTAEEGGGMYNLSSSPMVTNCTFNGNTVGPWGGGMFNGQGSPTVKNCIFINNDADVGGGMYTSSSSSTVTNCILWNNTAEEIFDYGKITIVSYSDIQGGFSGTGNINTDPCFVDAASGDFRLKAGSPCIDAGSNSAVPPAVTTDAAGHPRFIDGNCDTVKTVDMGTIEYSRRYQGDLDDNCVVNFEDFAILSNHWCSFAMDSDVAPGYGDGVVDLQDLAVLAARWLQGV